MDNAHPTDLVRLMMLTYLTDSLIEMIKSLLKNVSKKIINTNVVNSTHLLL